jgi:hypothetical protein
VRPALFGKGALHRAVAQTIAAEAESNATKNPSPVEFTTSPPWSTNTVRRVSSCQRRRCSQASSPMAAAMFVEATMSVNMNVLWATLGMAFRSVAARMASPAAASSAKRCSDLRRPCSALTDEANT